MKALITFFIAFTLSTPSFAQSSKITSSEFDKSNAYSSNVDLGIHNTNHYYLRKPLGTGDSKIVIVQNDIKIKSSSEIQLPKSKDLIEEVYLINGQLYIFFSYHLSKKHTLYAAKLSENGTFSTEPKEVYVIADCGPTSVEKGSYRISYSEDRKTFLIQVRHHKAEDIYYKLLDLSFNETNSFIYKHNSPDKNLSSIQSYLDESGNVHSIVFVGPKKNKEKRYEYSFCSYNVADKKWKNHPITVSGFYISQAFFMVKKDKIIVSGLFDDDQRQLKGSFIKEISLKTGSFTFEKKNNFEDAFLGKLNHVYPKNPRDDFRFTASSNYDNGDVLIIFEYQRSASDKTGTYDMLLNYYTANGELKWKLQLPKRQMVAALYSQTASFDVIDLGEGKKAILYNDNPKNSPKSLTPPESYLNVYKSITTMAIVDKDGGFEKKQLWDNLVEKAVFVPNSTYINEANELIFLSQKKTDIRFNKMKLE